MKSKRKILLGFGLVAAAFALKECATRCLRMMRARPATAVASCCAGAGSACAGTEVRRRDARAEAEPVAV